MPLIFTGHTAIIPSRLHSKRESRQSKFGKSLSLRWKMTPNSSEKRHKKLSLEDHLQGTDNVATDRASEGG